MFICSTTQIWNIRSRASTDHITANNNNTTYMKTLKHKINYESPRVDSINILAEGILCASGDKQGIWVDPMDVVSGQDNPWGWEE